MSWKYYLVENMKSFRKSNDLLQEACEASKKEVKKGFLNLLLGTQGSILLRTLLSGKGVIDAGKRVIRAAENF